MKFRKALLLLAVFLVSLLAVYYVHVLFFNVDVIFYSAILDGVLASGITAAVLLPLRWFRVFTGFEKTLMILLFLSFGYAFAISVPTVIDRSLSFYILEKLQQRGGSIPYASMDDVFKDEYMKEDHLVEVRMTEQLASGTIKLDQGMVELTPRGQFIATCSRFFRTHFLAKHRLLMGQYTDVLTDPFRK
jgi:hypothetical protein